MKIVVRNKDDYELHVSPEELAEIKNGVGHSLDQDIYINFDTANDINDQIELSMEVHKREYSKSP